MMDAGRHPRIQVLAYSEVEEVAGAVGNFRITVRKKARFVREELCNSCAKCAEVCPVIVPDGYQMGLSSRKAIHIPFPQAVPSAYLINLDDCLGNNPIACGKCMAACEKQCIDFDMTDRLLEFDVGAVIVATGMDAYDPTEITGYGYGRHDNVITSMEFERLICAGGPTAGHFARPSDQTRPRRIGFVQCVGSRSTQYGSPYCSNICCMNTVKDTLLLADHYPDTEARVFYMDIRAFGKGFEELFQRSKAAGVRYVRGIPGEIEEDPLTRNLRVRVENTLTGELEEHELDLIVLSVGVVPRLDASVVQRLLTLSKTSDGFFLEAHPKLKPVDAPTRGVYFAGCCESPKDIKDSVTQAGAAASHAQILLNAGRIRIEAGTPLLAEAACIRCGRCAGVCPFHAIHWVKGGLPEIVEAACAGCGNCAAECPVDAITMRHFTTEQLMAQVDAILADRPQEKLLTFACNWCSYAGGDAAGTARLQFPAHARLVRTMCSARVSEDLILHAFERGAPMVLVSGCHFADCHYIDANRQTVRRIERAWDALEQLGIRPERLQLEWISAAEGQKFAAVMRALDPLRRAVTREEIEHTMQALAQARVKREARKQRQREAGRATRDGAAAATAGATAAATAATREA
jgi:heterodisulfide reductase subunit A2